jgi:hypothetical protein
MVEKEANSRFVSHGTRHELRSRIINESKSFKCFIHGTEVSIPKVRRDWRKKEWFNLNQIREKKRVVSPIGNIDVNSWSNWEVSRDPTMAGTQGGGILPVDRRAQSISSKKGCLLISSASSSPEPNLAFGSLTNKCDSKSLAGYQNNRDA